MKEFTSDLFVSSPAHARITDPISSKEAAEEMRKSKANRLEQLVIRALKESPFGLTNHELVDRTGVNWTTITPRVRPLVNKGMVVDSGERRAGDSGVRCIVWKIA
jgi:predicted HTH transcriptional regulator